MQALEKAAGISGHPLPIFSPKKLREALRQAGNVVKPEEIEAVLLYVIKDKQFSELDKLYLALLLDGTVQQLQFDPQPHAKHQQTGKQFFVHGGENSLELYGLMQNSDHKKVQDSQGWREIARSVIQTRTANSTSFEKAFASGFLVHSKAAMCACAVRHACYSEFAPQDLMLFVQGACLRNMSAMMFGGVEHPISLTWLKTRLNCCRYGDQGGQAWLENGSMNVKTPSLKDLADSLPISWAGTICQRGCGGDHEHPGEAWLASFWHTASQHQWETLPARLRGFLLVPLAGDKLASAAFCSSQPTLTSVHLARACRVQPDAALVLSDLGCMCITEPQAEIASTLPGRRVEPVTLALSAAAEKCSMPLQWLISEEHLGPDKYNSICLILANLKPSPKCQQRVQTFLRQCTVFEDLTGARLDLAKRSDIKVLPKQKWEQSMLAVQDFFPWTLIKYHSASDIQKNLLHAAGFGPLDVLIFLTRDLLPEVYSSASTELEPLLLQALDTLAHFPALQLQQPLQVFVNGRLQRVSTLVDTSSDLMKALFAKGSGYAGYDLLPDEYIKDNRLAALRAHGLAYDDLPDPKCFLACADQFVRLYEEKDRSVSMVKHSRLLLEMLQGNVSSYKLTACAQWEDIRHLIATKPIFVRASVVAPYDNTTAPLLVSLQDSEDWTHYRLVGSVAPVLEPLSGSSTIQLREQLSLPAGPQLLRVIDHLLQTARARNDQLQNQHAPPPLDTLIKDDIEKAYKFIVEVLNQDLAHGQRSELAKLSKKLMQAPWVMVQAAERFVAPCDLVFDIEEDLDHGELPLCEVLRYWWHLVPACCLAECIPLYVGSCLLTAPF